MAVIGSVIAAVVIAAISWGGQDLRPTLQYETKQAQEGVEQAREQLRSEVAQVEKFSRGTRKLVLSDRWFRLKAQISQVQGRLAPGLARPGPEARAALEELLVQLEAQLKAVEDQQEALK